MMKPKAEITPRPSRAMQGRVTQLLRGRACGFIRASDGQDVFFHAHDMEGAKYSDVEVHGAVDFDLIEDVVSGPRAARVRVTNTAK